MRSLMMGLRAPLKQSPSTPTPTTPAPVRTVTALRQWMARARVPAIQHFESRLQRDMLAVEAAGTEQRSKRARRRPSESTEDNQAPDEHRAGVELLRARLIPLSVEPTLLQPDSL